MTRFKRRSLLTGGAATAVSGGMALGVSGPASAGNGHSHVPDPVEITPEDSRYPDVVRGDNNRWVGEPESVVLAHSTSQVVDALRQAFRDGKRVTVRSGGHCYEDFVYNPDVETVIDLSEMDRIGFDSRMNAFAIEPGALVGEVYETLYRHWGVTIPGPTCPTVAAGGSFTGGAYGVLNRSMGLAVDYLYGVEVVVADRYGNVKSVVATRDSHYSALRDLWWAHTGGGGGNFGIVTRFWMRDPNATSSQPTELLPAPPGEVWICQVGFPWAALNEDGFTRMLRNFGAWHEANSAPDSPGTDLFARLNVTNASNDANMLSIQADAEQPGITALMDDFIDAVAEGTGVTPFTIQRHTLPWLKATRWSGMFGGDGTGRADFKSVYMKQNFPQSQARTIYRHLTDSEYQHPIAQIQISSFGGKTNTVDPAATAQPHRDSVMKLMYLVGWSDEADDDLHIGWLRRFYRDVYADTGGVPVPNDVTDGCFVNYCDIDLSSPEWNDSGVPWHELYYKDNYSRLQRAKSDWDPHGVFHHGQSVQPA